MMDTLTNRDCSEGPRIRRTLSLYWVEKGRGRSRGWGWADRGSKLRLLVAGGSCWGRQLN